MITGAAIGAAQSTLVPRGRSVWTAITAIGWSFGWLTIVDIEQALHRYLGVAPTRHTPLPTALGAIGIVIGPLLIAYVAWSAWLVATGVALLVG